MNILNLNLPRCHFHTLIELAKSGHNVYTNYESVYEYESSLGIKSLTEKENRLVNKLQVPGEFLSEEEEIQYEKDKKEFAPKFIQQLIDKYNIDILQVSIPDLGYLHTHFKDKIKYIGPSEEASLLETNKLYAKKLAIEIGLKTPNIIKHGKYLEEDYCKDLSLPAIEKPSNMWSPAVVITSEEEVELLKKRIEEKEWPRHINNDYYIEEFLYDIIETNVYFVISNGKYVVEYTQEIIGEGLNKTIIPSVWYFNAYIKPLRPFLDKIARQSAEKYLEHIAKMGGNWEGSFCGAYTPDGEWYFLEINVRPDIFNSSPTFMTGDEYIEGMFKDISLFEKAWENKACDKYIITSNEGNEYPIHLHDKYNVSYPNNLVIEDNKYFISDWGVASISDRGTVVADHNIPKEFIREVEETTPWRFNGEPK